MQSQEDGIPLPEYHGSIWTTWTVSFEAIRSNNEGAADPLSLWVLLDHRDLWHELFERKKKDSWTRSLSSGTPLWEVLSDEVRFYGAPRLLLNHTLLEEMEDLEGYVVHPIVHRRG